MTAFFQLMRGMTMRTFTALAIIVAAMTLPLEAQIPCPGDTEVCKLIQQGPNFREEICKTRTWDAGCRCYIESCLYYTHVLINDQYAISSIYGCGTLGPICPTKADGEDCPEGQTYFSESTIGSYFTGTELVEVNDSCGNNSPIVLDVDGNGYGLTSAGDGVSFDLNGDGLPEKLSWTAAGSDDAFLAADRDGNGLIEKGRELFGNFTPQYATTEPNGYLALAVYDRAADGGNDDGVIDDRDRVFPLLLLWTDRNHNGISEADELRGLAESGVRALHLNYKESKRTDEHGNEFRFRAKVDRIDSTVARWSWDVFLVRE